MGRLRSTEESDRVQVWINDYISTYVTRYRCPKSFVSENVPPREKSYSKVCHDAWMYARIGERASENLYSPVVCL